MKKSIDPNLNGFDNEDILLELTNKQEQTSGSGFGFADPSDSKRNEFVQPNFVVSEKGDQSAKRTISQDVKAFAKAQKENDDVVAKDKTDSSGSQSSESHHHSSHHHSSSGHHHSSHHHSSSGHHHSSHHHHHHSSHHHDDKKKKKKLPLAAKIAIAFIAIILIIALLIGGTFGYLKYTGQKDIMPVISEDTEYSETIEYNGHTYKYNEDVFAIGFVGVDQSSFMTSDQTDFVGAGDADIVLTVDTKTGKTSAIAIPRDTMVDIDMYSESGIFLRTQKAQLCLAYAYGDGAEKSCRNAIGSMSRVLYSVPIQKYFVLDLDGIAPLNDAIGGVTVSSLYDFNDIGIKKGDTVEIHGDMAEKYVRARDMDNIEASLNRVQRQVQYVKAYSQQVVPAVMRDFGVVSKLYNTAQSYSKTNISLNSATYIASLLLSKGVTSFDTYTISGEMRAAQDPELPNVVHAELYADEDSIMEAILNTFYTQID